MATKSPATKKSTTRPARLPLGRDRVIRAALALADRSGVEALSMRGLARKLGVEAMSLYRHVANKDDVLDGLVDLVIGEIEIPPLAVGWRAAMRGRAISARQVFLRHPWAATLFESRTSMSGIRLGYADAVLGILRRSGFAVSAAYRSFLLVDSYLYGFMLQELSWPSGEAERRRMATQMGPLLAAAGHLHLAEVMTHVGSAPAGFDLDVEFERGLDLILDCLDRLRG